jgi:hypothetical protein
MGAVQRVKDGLSSSAHQRLLADINQGGRSWGTKKSCFQRACGYRS